MVDVESWPKKMAVKKRCLLEVCQKASKLKRNGARQFKFMNRQRAGGCALCAEKNNLNRSNCQKREGCSNAIKETVGATE